MPPILPDNLKFAQVAGYVTAHSLLPDESRVYGTESLYGEWNGSVLLLAKDFAPSKYIREQIGRRVQRPYSHDPTLSTNRRLQAYVRNAFPKSTAIMYGSALGNLLRDDGKWRGTLPNWDRAVEHGARVLQFVLDNMPSLAAILCLGTEAFECVQRVLNVPGDGRILRERGAVVRHGNFTIGVSYHPVASVNDEVKLHAWRGTAACVREL